jgi:trehalose synthase
VATGNVIVGPAPDGAAGATRSPGGEGSARRARGHRRILHVSALRAGEVAEAVRGYLDRGREAGLDIHWATVSANGAFMATAERLSSQLRGSTEGGVELGEDERRTYTAVLEVAAGMLTDMAGAPAAAVLHDPATAGLCGPMKRTGAAVVWVCHLSLAEPDEASRAARDFLASQLEAADSLIFLRSEHVPGRLARAAVCDLRGQDWIGLGASR